MKKSIIVFLTLFLLLMFVAALAYIIGLLWMAIVAVALAVWWGVYFLCIKYTISNNCLVIYSGLLYRKTRKLPIKNILWITYVKPLAACRAAMSLLHTAGGCVVIFADFSTIS